MLAALALVSLILFGCGAPDSAIDPADLDMVDLGREFEGQFPSGIIRLEGDCWAEFYASSDRPWEFDVVQLQLPLDCVIASAEGTATTVGQMAPEQLEGISGGATIAVSDDRSGETLIAERVELGGTAGKTTDFWGAAPLPSDEATMPAATWSAGTLALPFFQSGAARFLWIESAVAGAGPVWWTGHTQIGVVDSNTEVRSATGKVLGHGPSVLDQVLSRPKPADAELALEGDVVRVTSVRLGE